MKRRSIGIKTKKRVLEELKDGETVRSIARKYGVSPSNIRDWRKKTETILETNNNNYTCHQGPKFLNYDNVEHIIEYAEGMRSSDLPCDTNTIATELIRMVGETEINPLEYEKFRQRVRRIMKASSFSIREGTHVAQIINSNIFKFNIILKSIGDIQYTIFFFFIETKNSVK